MPAGAAALGPGDVVWAQFEKLGHWWPAVVARDADTGQTVNDEGQFFVMGGIGSNEERRRSWVSPSALRRWEATLQRNGGTLVLANSDAAAKTSFVKPLNQAAADNGAGPISARRRPSEATIVRIGVGDLPAPALRHILLAVQSDNLLRHVSICARVCAEWRRVVGGSVAYGLGLPRKRDEYLEREDRDNEEERQRWAAAGHGEWLPRGYVCGDVYRPHYRPGDDDRARVLRLIEGKLRPSSAPGTIVFLDEQDGGIGDEGAAVLAAALLSMPRIRFTGLKLTDSDLSSVGVDALVPALRRPWGFSSSQLVGGYVGMKELWVGGGSETGGGGDEFTGIGDAGVTALAKVLPPTLEDLDFAYAGCSDVGFLAMVAALPALSRLTVLWCHCNPRVTARGWTAVFRTLPSLPALERLFASGSSMGLEGARALTAAIPECPRLRELCVDANDLPPEAQDALDAVGIQEGVMMELD